MNWSRQVFDIYDLPANQPGPDFEEYFARVHPDDREAARAVYASFSEKNEAQIEFEHRVIARDGSVRYIKGVGERQESSGREVVIGYFLDITSLIRSQHKLTQAEQLLRLAGEKARLGGWQVELVSETILWTPETAAIHGMPADYSPASVAEATQFYTPGYRGFIQSVFEQCAREGEAFDVTCQLQTPDGRRPWVRVIGLAERDQNGRISAVQGAFQDITTLHEAQARAAEAERQRLNVLESISDGFFALDDHWNFTYVNQQACEFMERSRDQLLGKKLWDEFPEAVGTEFQCQYQWVLENQQTRQFQGVYAPLGKWFDVSAYPIPDGLAVYFRDVTLERERQEQLRLVEAALSRQNDIVIITEADTLDEPNGPRIVYVNDAFEGLTGYAKSEAIGLTPRILQGPETDRQQLDRIHIALQNKESIRCEVLNYHKSGESYWLELDITPLFDDTGHCSHFVAVERDITQRKAMEQQLRESQKLEAVGHLTGGVAHDFNNLLTVILGNTEMLVELLDDPDLRAMAEMTVSAAQRGAELTKRLLAFARRQPLDPKATDINQLVATMQALIRRTLPENIVLEFISDPDLGITEIDGNELDTALLNLVVNARDAMPRGGKLTIETANRELDSEYAERYTEVAPGEYVMVCVSDTGTGMDPDTVRRAFEPFFTTKSVGKGSGLGLSMVFGFTKQSGGHLKIYSEPGEGTTVKLYFRRMRGAHYASYQPAAALLVQGGTEHILIAEDDDLVLKHLETQLLSLGYRVTSATSGPEALSVLQAQRDIGLLFTDIIMPGGMNGRELADQARAVYPLLKVLFTSGYTENAIVHQGRLDPGVDLLSKPYTRLELATKVREVLDR
ncbi:PAS domain S-box protein [Nitrincola sp. MINF-07-Sa-05]|uniref:PAS domain S-box protein n=1 Tax=Nitrincola salilacus TaxID=3400273 RepID=UPI003918121E